MVHLGKHKPDVFGVVHAKASVCQHVVVKEPHLPQIFRSGCLTIPGWSSSSNILPFGGGPQARGNCIKLSLDTSLKV